MRLRWTPAAAGDLEQIHDFLTENHPRTWFAPPSPSCTTAFNL